MSDAFFDKFIADLVKGASHNLRENGGVGVNILVDRENRGHEEKLASMGGALLQRYEDGAKAAAMRLGIKEAFLPLLAAAGEIAGPMLARAGLGRLAAGAGGKMLGGIAGKVAPRIAGGVGGAVFNQAAGMAGGALGQRLQPQHLPGAMPPL